MKRQHIVSIVIVSASLAVCIGLAANDKYTVKVPGGLAFSEFRGYEAWQAIPISGNDRGVAVSLANPQRIKPYRARSPGNGRPVPNRATMATVTSKSKLVRSPIRFTTLRHQTHWTSSANTESRERSSKLLVNRFERLITERKRLCWQKVFERHAYGISDSDR